MEKKKNRNRTERYFESSGENKSSDSESLFIQLLRENVCQTFGKTVLFCVCNDGIRIAFCF